MMRSTEIKEMILFKSGITRLLYKDFVSSLNVRSNSLSSQPFVYVDSEENVIRLLTDAFEGSNDEFLAFSIASHGDVEVLSTEG